MNRRNFVSAAVCAGSSSLLEPFARALPLSPAPPAILDGHVHLFDPTRAGGVPWPEPGDLIYRPALPARLEALAAPLGVVGAIAIEASPLATDNDWLLRACEQSTFMVGFIGDLVPGSPGFRADLERLHRSPLFLGVRYGNLWKRDLAADLARAQTQREFVDDLRALAGAGLTFESANPNPDLIAALLAVAQQVPELRLVIDHLPHAQLPVDASALRLYNAHLAELARSPNVFVKLSEVLLPRPGEVQRSSVPYVARLESLWSLFGPDRILFGSDWPNSDHVAPYEETLAVAEDYVRRRSPAARAHVFFSNSRRAYQWQPRRESQRGPVARPGAPPER